MYSQAASQGITTLVSSGDAGVTGCAVHGVAATTTSTPTPIDQRHLRFQLRHLRGRNAVQRHRSNPFRVLEQRATRTGYFESATLLYSRRRLERAPERRFERRQRSLCRSCQRRRPKHHHRQTQLADRHRRACGRGTRHPRHVLRRGRPRWLFLLPCVGRRQLRAQREQPLRLRRVLRHVGFGSLHGRRGGPARPEARRAAREHQPHALPACSLHARGVPRHHLCLGRGDVLLDRHTQHLQ